MSDRLAAADLMFNREFRYSCCELSKYFILSRKVLYHQAFRHRVRMFSNVNTVFFSMYMYNTLCILIHILRIK